MSITVDDVTPPSRVPAGCSSDTTVGRDSQEAQHPPQVLCASSGRELVRQGLESVGSCNCYALQPQLASSAWERRTHTWLLNSACDCPHAYAGLKLCSVLLQNMKPPSESPASVGRTWAMRVADGLLAEQSPHQPSGCWTRTGAVMH